MFESQILRLLVYIVGFYTLIAALHQLIVTNLFDYQSWVLNAVNQPTIATMLISLAIPIGIAVISAAYFNRRKILLWALGISFTYQVGSVILNVIDTVGMGTPTVTGLFLGFVVATLWSYFRLQPDGLRMEKVIDNSIDGVKIIEQDDKHDTGTGN